MRLENIGNEKMKTAMIKSFILLMVVNLLMLIELKIKNLVQGLTLEKKGII